MFSVYAFLLIVTGILLLVSILSDFTDADVGDADTDVDADTGVDTDGSGVDYHPSQVFSIRGLIYFGFGFGLTGVLLHLWYDGEAWALTLMLATMVGITSAFFATILIAWLKSSESGGTLRDSGYVGLSGKMSVPFGDGGVGRVVVIRNGQSIELAAHPYEDTEGDPKDWRSVVVVEMRNGRAYVAPGDDLLL